MHLTKPTPGESSNLGTFGNVKVRIFVRKRFLCESSLDETIGKKAGYKMGATGIEPMTSTVSR